MFHPFILLQVVGMQNLILLQVLIFFFCQKMSAQDIFCSSSNNLIAFEEKKAKKVGTV